MKKDTHTPSEVLAQYLENQKDNAHAENYMLLAEYFEDEHAISAAHGNLSYIKRCGHANYILSGNAYTTCNHYYSTLVKLAKNGVVL